MTWVSRVLGHSDPAMTLRVYAHVAHVLPEESGGLDFLGGGPKVGERWAKIAPPQNPLTQPFDYVEEYMVTRVRFAGERSSPSASAGGPRPPASRTHDPQLRRLEPESE